MTLRQYLRAVHGPLVVPGGLGHANLLDRLVPTPVSSQLLGGSRVGRCHSLPAEHALAFAMGTHAPLVGGPRTAGFAGRRRSRQLQGKTAKDDEENSGYWFLMMPGELVKRIVEASGSWPQGEGGRLGEGVARLMGALPLAGAQEEQVKEEQVRIRNSTSTIGRLGKAKTLLNLLEQVLPRDDCGPGTCVILGKQWIFPKAEQLALMEEQFLDRDIVRATTELNRQKRQKAKLARAQEEQVRIALAGGVATCPAPARRWSRRSSCSCSCSLQ
jgi:hypothetical protein